MCCSAPGQAVDSHAGAFSQDLVDDYSYQPSSSRGGAVPSNGDPRNIRTQAAEARAAGAARAAAVPVLQDANPEVGGGIQVRAFERPIGLGMMQNPTEDGFCICSREQRRATPCREPLC